MALRPSSRGRHSRLRARGSCRVLLSIRGCRVLQLQIESRWNLRSDLINKKKRSAAQWRKREALTPSYWALRLDVVACRILSIKGRQSGAPKNLETKPKQFWRIHFIAGAAKQATHRLPAIVLSRGPQISLIVVTFRVSEGLHVPAKVWTLLFSHWERLGMWNLE